VTPRNDCEIEAESDEPEMEIETDSLDLETPPDDPEMASPPVQYKPFLNEFSAERIQNLSLFARLSDHS
jgi:hypothetical protein